MRAPGIVVAVSGLGVFRSRRMLVLLLLGFASGLPAVLVGHTLRAWLTDAGFDNDRISAFVPVGLAYTFKFLWAPALDRFALPFLGRRRGWIFVLQLALVAAIVVMGAVDPQRHAHALWIAALVVAVLSASQDVVLDAYSADILEPHERAAGSATYVLGYRIAMVATGALALVMADRVVWPAIYATMAALMALGIAATLLAEEPTGATRSPRTLAEAVYLPIVELGKKHGWRGAVLVASFAALYKLGDQFAQVLTLTFLQRDAGFDWTEIGTVYDVIGFAGIAAGGIAGGALVARYGLYRLLFGFGVIQASTLLLYAWLAVAGKSFPIFCIAVVVDNFAYSMATSAFVACLMSACTPGVSATQMALLTSLSSVGQRVLGLFASNVADTFGWAGYFIACSAMALPGLILAPRLRRLVR
jgi:PAT family beta-lactamase induction signal transducer AmpG